MTGVDTSTRPVRRVGREGKRKKSTSLRAAAEVKRMAFRRSMTMLDVYKRHVHIPFYMFIDLRPAGHYLTEVGTGGTKSSRHASKSLTLKYPGRG